MSKPQLRLKLMKETHDLKLMLEEKYKSVAEEIQIKVKFRNSGSNEQ